MALDQWILLLILLHSQRYTFAQATPPTHLPLRLNILLLSPGTVLPSAPSREQPDQYWPRRDLL